MHKVRLNFFWRLVISLFPGLIVCFVGHQTAVAGVTIITHGDSSDVNGWITGMADQIPAYGNLGTNFTTYKIVITYTGGNYFYQWSRTNGSPPSVTASGEIIVKLDWGQMTGFLGRSTRDVAPMVSALLLQTNLIAELNGHALAEFPLHLIGHSRGGSLISEMSRILGTNGIWVDHLTKLDPHPVNNDGNSEPFYPTDATASNTYANVLFADNYWEDLEAIDGSSAAGAYNRRLVDFSGGYNLAHSDVHLWYHGTVDGRTPTSDTEAGITATQRTNWWTAYESSGTRAGFCYSLIGGADRMSLDEPMGAGFAMIRDGYNQWWDLGAGTASNRTALSANNGNWPNLIKFNRTTTNQVAQGQTMPVKFYYQWAQPNQSLATISIFLDDDLNPLNGNQTLLKEVAVPGSGASFVNCGTTNLTIYASNATPGVHAVLAKISGGGRTRFLYAPEMVEIISGPQPVLLDIAKLSATQFRIGVTALPGQTVILQTSTDLSAWTSLVTNTATQWTYTNNPPANSNQRFYRAVPSP